MFASKKEVASMIRVHIDFEYNSTAEPRLNLVCASLDVYVKGKLTESLDYWLHKDNNEKIKLKKKLIEYRDKGAYICAFAASAEAASFISLGLDPVKFKWLCLQVMYRILTNHNDQFSYGKQLIDGKEKITYPPIGKWKGKTFSNQKNQTSLVACTYKILGVHRSLEHKDEMRNLIISKPHEFNDEERTAIMDYCREDVENMEALTNKMYYHLTRYYKGYTNQETLNALSGLSNYAAYTALMERRGYPVHPEKLHNFVKNVPNVIRDMVDDILSQELPIVPFVWDKRASRYKMEQKVIRQWLEENYGRDDWDQTTTNQYSLSLDAFSRKYSYRHDYPRDNLGAQIVRYLKLLQSLNGFKPKSKTAKNKETFLDFYGTDNRARPYMNIFGSQSGRSQPKATGFIPLKAAWMRSLIEPEPGNAIVAIDWGSQEFLISAIVSGDENMYKAYESGDVYLYFAKLAGAVPWDGTKAQYKKERNLFKSTVLGISYNMGAVALGKKLTADTGESKSTEDAQELIEKFQTAFPKFTEWNETNLQSYRDGNPIIMPDHWAMLLDNRNWRSVNNVPIQGAGASIMRLAVKYAYEREVKIIYTLHDALYAEFNNKDIEIVDTLYDCMKDAFVDVWTNEQQREWASIIRQDIDVWGPGMCELYLSPVTPKGREFKLQDIYIDERSEAEYERFKKYF